jgi:biopolymer transport protein ExbB/TolQ
MTLHPVERRMNQKAAEVRHDLGQGLWCLGSVSATAFLFGSLEMILRVIQAFGMVGCGDDVCRAASFLFKLANTLCPALAGLLIAVPTHLCYRAFREQQEQFALEMRLATSEVLTFLERTAEEA